MVNHSFNLEGIWQSPLFQRFWAVAGAASIRVKVLGIVLGVIFLLGFFVTVQMRASLSNTLQVELEHQGQAIAEVISHTISPLIRTSDSQDLNELLRERQEHYTGGDHNTLVDYIVVEDSSSNTIAYTLGKTLPSNALSIIIKSDHKGAGVQALDMPWGHIIDAVVPLTAGEGVLRLGLSDDNIQETVNVVTLQIISTTLIMVIVGLAAAFFLTWILARPILSLVEATQAVAKGDFSRQVRRWANDEIGDLAEAFNAMTRALAQAEQERAEREILRANYMRGVIQAQEDERKRIARELHDSTSQSLTSLLVGLRSLEETTDLAALKPRLDDIRKVVSGTLDEVHSLSWQLRPSVLDDLGLVVALQRYIADYERRYGIEVDFVAHGMDGRLPLELETSIYRMVQESLTNVARHAHARKASILLEKRQQNIRVIIEDNGIGFDPGSVEYSQGSLGLQGIRERAQLFGGKLTIESQAGQGASLFIEIPQAR